MIVRTALDDHPVPNPIRTGDSSPISEALVKNSARPLPVSRTRGGVCDRSFAGIIHEDFYCNRRYAAPTSLATGGLAAQSVNIQFQVCFPPSRLRAPISRGVAAVSVRTLVNNVALLFSSTLRDSVAPQLSRLQC
jgi:hypothetical protein